MGPEAQFQSQILQICDARSVLAYHTHDSRRSQRGFPDLALVGDRGLLFVELKTDEPGSKLSEEQVMWGEALTDAEVHHQVWRPSMLQTVCIPQISALGRCSALVRFKQQKAEREARAMFARRNARLQGE